ncbi:MAG: hypothetical protein ACM3ON_02650 [Chloroflexota bacterium]
MKRTSTIGRKGVYIGAAAGLLLFAVLGLLPSSFIGGVLGLKMASYFVGNPVDAGVTSRAIVGMTMVLGIFITGVVFVGGAGLTGWLLGQAGLSLRNRTVQKLA